MTCEGMEITWHDIGIAFSIPPGAVPEDKEMKLVVRPCLRGPFVPPEGYDLSSPVHIISPSYNFLKDVQLVLYHFADLQSNEDCEQMSFISTSSSPQLTGSHPLYMFKQLKGGVFPAGQQFGTISLRHFCGAATSRKRRSHHSPTDAKAKRHQGKHIPLQVLT